MQSEISGVSNMKANAQSPQVNKKKRRPRRPKSSNENSSSSTNPTVNSQNFVSTSAKKKRKRKNKKNTSAEAKPEKVLSTTFQETRFQEISSEEQEGQYSTGLNSENFQANNSCSLSSEGSKIDIDVKTAIKEKTQTFVQNIENKLDIQKITPETMNPPKKQSNKKKNANPESSLDSPKTVDKNTLPTCKESQEKVLNNNEKTSPNFPEPQQESSPKVEKNSNNQRINKMSNDRSREEILAARESKKLAKQQAKTSTKMEKNTVKGKNDTVENNANMTDDTKSATKFIVKETIKIESTAPQQAVGKSREEILAKREAKKLEKQMGKSKIKIKGPTEDAGESDVILDSKQNESISKEILKKTISGNTEGVEKNFAKDGPDPKEGKADKVDHNVEELNINKTEGEKKKSTTKAERRAIQEAQRAAKAKLQVQKQQQLQKKDVATSRDGLKTEIDIKKVEKTSTIQSVCKLRTFKVKLFNHLEAKFEEQNCFINNQLIHPAMVKLGEQYSKRTIVGSNARCIAFLNVLKMVIQDYETPPKKEFSRSLEGSLKICVDYLQKCRPLAVSVSNAYKYIKFVLTKLPENQTESDLKKHIVELIDIYLKDQIEKAAQAINTYVQGKISNGDVILTYGCSSLINYILEEAHRKRVDFRVIVVDSRPFSEGQELLRRLVSKGLSCTCVLINAIGFIMPEVTKVLLGAHALLANGYVMSRTGTAQLALVARSFNVPVLVCCETHKFSERVLTDAIVYNELGDPNDLISKTKDCRLSNWKTYPSLYPLNLNYDVTPPELVTAVVTEVAFLPCTSVPVILRIRPNEMIC